MPSLSGRFDRETGIIVQIGATAAGSFGPLADEGQAQVPVIRLFSALVDTGASCTCLSQSIVRDLGLSAVGKTEVQAAGGTHSANVYLVDLLLVYGAQQIVIPNIQVTEFNIGAEAPFQALLGRDVLGDGVLTMSFDGHFTLSH